MRLTFRSLMTAGMLCAALLVPGTAVAAPAPAPAAAQPDRTAPVESLRHGPVGVWSGLVISSSVGEVEATMALLGDGRLCLVVPPPGPDGGVEGTGYWYRTSEDTFSFLVIERFFDGEGETTAYLQAGYEATMNGDGFTALGEGSFYSSDGQSQGDFTAVMEMSREDTEPAC